MNILYTNNAHRLPQQDAQTASIQSETIRTILERNNLTVAKAGKGKPVVVINRDVLRQKFDNFIQKK
jgi:hypothetical protein